MNINQTIDVFEERIDFCSEILRKLKENEIPIDGENRLKDTLNSIQQQNSSILIELNLMKRKLKIDDLELDSNVFYSINNDPILNTKGKDFVCLDEVKLSRYETLGHTDVLNTIDTDSNRIETRDKLVKKQKVNCTKAFGDTFEIPMIENPKTVHELYYDFQNCVKETVRELKEKYGKSYFRKATNIRSYQRRRALVSEIQKLSEEYDIDIEEALQCFEELRKENYKTVPWLYSNLLTVVHDVRESYVLEKNCNWNDI
ncbi:hypothetical protein KAFR_0D05020 [Kazachstania africana CBS 2517]|uniref:Transcription activator GCR1-like domain-containing protein n=1 Tax=Kazachstania africana (strain ATCC 22294 / BCRC 22015 / CBS 2517 / CECT 1963 / NBRC 1671 / NRRL Y-8276) TaxID=1071382 RepID=H2AUU9_KAZAF|nr:hypothetical protein KAFR_0D05020 [Kazachstania africana CBS 2517]CCF58149.1 hypothetical protein KAFR_0D05020 [Kazachstania africana CBS 2517]